MLICRTKLGVLWPENLGVQICLIQILEWGVLLALVCPQLGKELNHSPTTFGELSSGTTWPEGPVTTPGSCVAQQCLRWEVGRQSWSLPQQSQYWAWTIPLLYRQGLLIAKTEVALGPPNQRAYLGNLDSPEYPLPLLHRQGSWDIALPAVDSLFWPHQTRRAGENPQKLYGPKGAQTER